MTLKALDLFSGTQSISKVLRERGWEVITLDIDRRSNPDICCDIREWDFRQFPPGHFDFIWASPCCVMYSIARTTASTPRDFEWADSLVQAALRIIEYFNPSKGWILENPLTGFLKTREFMRNVPVLCDQAYCKWNPENETTHPYQKKTRFWGVLPGGFQTKLCKKDCRFSDGKRHFHTAQRRKARYNQSSDSAYSVNQLHSIPQPLCEAFAAKIESDAAIQN